MRLVLFDDHAIIAALVDHRLCDVALSQERVHRDDTTFEDQWLEERLNGCDLIGFVVNGVLSEGDAYLVRQRR